MYMCALTTIITISKSVYILKVHEFALVLPFHQCLKVIFSLSPFLLCNFLLCEQESLLSLFLVWLCMCSSSLSASESLPCGSHPWPPHSFAATFVVTTPPPPGEMEGRGGEERRGKGKQEKANLFRVEGRNSLFFFNSLFKKKIVSLFLLCWVLVAVWAFLQLRRAGATLWSRGTGFSLQWLLLLWSTGSRVRRLRQLWPWAQGAQLLHGRWDLLGPAIEHTSAALASRFFTTEPPGKSLMFSFKHHL